MPTSLSALLVVVLLATPLLARTANNNSAYGFTANTFLVYENVTYYNHIFFIGYTEARSQEFRLNPTRDSPTTSCPTTVKDCPKPTPSSAKTQFNTTLLMGGDAGKVFMNVEAKGGQQLYVTEDGKLRGVFSPPIIEHSTLAQADEPLANKPPLLTLPGLLQFTEPAGTPPDGSYAHLFSLVVHYTGSQLEVAQPTLEFNNSIYWYSCAPPKDNGFNLTYAETPSSKKMIQDCLPFALISDAAYYSGYNACAEDPTISPNGTVIYPQCGYAAYQYV